MVICVQTFKNTIIFWAEKNQNLKEGGKSRDYLVYYRGSGCWSSVGRVGGKQYVSIGYGCESVSYSLFFSTDLIV